ncbi:MULTISPECIES: globin family protein [Chelatococcus]|uniref:Hemoglobin-like flavoprotein n=1 Tax=Chelatococcus caeni TaxID=1348468 RepID=A0A840C2U9_9HYPH|nr:MULTISPECIES: globin family protein [Chelatococcus]ALA16830.1 hemin receptor [Chelatococcus sp. CO-6]MBB4019855.1 hemoglobin-like flavoprotein [Chelatococcus caeni]
MNDETIHLLETSFAEVAAIREPAAALFYERLFANDPSLRSLFGGADMKAQGQKLMAALGFVVGGLRKPATVVPTLESLAIRHLDYGVRDSHYTTVGTALIETLALSFGARFTPELRKAWTEAYDLVSTIMREAAVRSRAPAVA